MVRLVDLRPGRQGCRILVCGRRHLRDGWRSEETRQRKLLAKRQFHLSQKMSDLQRMTSQIEEAGGYTERLDLQSLLPNGGNPPLHRGPRRDKVVGRLHANWGLGMHFSPA